MSEAERDQGLSVRRDGDLISITIGVAALKTATEAAPHWPHPGPVVTDVDEWAKSILWAINDEREDGTTFVHLMFDAAMERAAHFGELGIEFPAEPVSDSIPQEDESRK